jgi:hypothetical protein
MDRVHRIFDDADIPVIILLILINPVNPALSPAVGNAPDLGRSV